MLNWGKLELLREKCVDEGEVQGRKRWILVESVGKFLAFRLIHDDLLD
jgi:hypothetical protein